MRRGSSDAAPYAFYHENIMSCKSCAHSRNCINGRYCPIIKNYVEYNKTICNEYKAITADRE